MRPTAARQRAKGGAVARSDGLQTSSGFGSVRPTASVAAPPPDASASPVAGLARRVCGSRGPSPASPPPQPAAKSANATAAAAPW